MRQLRLAHSIRPTLKTGDAVVLLRMAHRKCDRQRVESCTITGNSQQNAICTLIVLTILSGTFHLDCVHQHRCLVLLKAMAYNLFRVYADLLHVIAVCIVLHRLHVKKNAQGKPTQLCCNSRRHGHANTCLSTKLTQLLFK